LSVCQWITQAEAVRSFATHSGTTQSQGHIKPLHWYVACRLVLEGGFRPEDITPRPPFRVTGKSGAWVLHYDSSVATGGERTILGGLKTKNVDVVVTKDGLGPVLAVSCKGMTGAFRNLTNRMEETIGECTNLHITYPALVFGYLFLIRANRATDSLLEEVGQQATEPSRLLKANDIAIGEGGEPVESILRFHSALRELTGRKGIRNDVSRYESVALALADMRAPNSGQILDDFPAEDSPLRVDRFFANLYLRYDERFVYSAPDLKSETSRLAWLPSSPALEKGGLVDAEAPLDYAVRTAD
jgi:hypothetical protein